MPKQKARGTSTALFNYLSLEIPLNVTRLLFSISAAERGLLGSAGRCAPSFFLLNEGVDAVCEVLSTRESVETERAVPNGLLLRVYERRGQHGCQEVNQMAMRETGDEDATASAYDAMANAFTRFKSHLSLL